MGIEGRLEFKLHVNAGQVTQVEVVSSRPLQITKMFVGKSPDDVLKLVPSLYSICATAQTAASVRAMEHALGIGVAPEIEAARDVAVWAETAREHLLRLVMMLGQTSDSFSVADIMPLTHEFIKSLGYAFQPGCDLKVDVAGLNATQDRLQRYLDDSVFAQRAEDWLAFTTPLELETWAETGATDAAQLVAKTMQGAWAGVGRGTQITPLAHMAPQQLLESLKFSGFVAQPTWDGLPCETTPLSRHADHPLVAAFLKRDGAGLQTRLVALLVELASITTLQRNALTAPPSQQDALPTEGVGLAQLEAARGRLVHAVWLEDGVVDEYKVLAPTEWNFHPNGVIVEALKTVSADNSADISDQAKAMIGAIDPCVAFDVTLI